MISISMTVADSLGNIILKKGKSRFGKIAARISRQATLDGGCVITHSGVSQSDRQFDIETQIDTGQKVIVEYIHENSVLVNVSCSEGFFLGAISYIDTSSPVLKMTILIKSKEA